jgi:hypothetical protein
MLSPTLAVRGGKSKNEILYGVLIFFWQEGAWREVKAVHFRNYSNAAPVRLGRSPGEHGGGSAT